MDHLTKLNTMAALINQNVTELRAAARLNTDVQSNTEFHKVMGKLEVNVFLMTIIITTEIVDRNNSN